MKDLVAPLSRHMFRGGRFGMGHHAFDLATQHPLIKLEGRLSLSAEEKIWIQLHVTLLWAIDDVKLVRV